MSKFVLIVLLALSLVATTVLSLFANPAQRPTQHMTHLMDSPISPLPTQTGSDSSDDSDPFQRPGPIASGVVWAPQADSNQMWIKTHQIGVGWWDADGKLHIALQVNGMVKIPLETAVMISIPRDAAGVLAPPGWKKMMRPENGEWVIVRKS
ncbi:MAG: hypothetical protein R3E79_37670 [Caldilineaceae bacterium]